MRTAVTAMESYYVDHNSYPRSFPNVNNGTRGGFHSIMGLSTPVAYIITTELMDPFNPLRAENPYGSARHTVTYINIQVYRKWRGDPAISNPRYGIFCYGPDRVKGPDATADSSWNTSEYGRDAPAPHQNDHYFKAWQYDSTNGTKSKGDIITWG